MAFLLSNHFNCEFNRALVLGHWSFNIDSSRTIRSDKKRSIFQRAIVDLPKWKFVFDGENKVFTSGPLPDEDEQFQEFIEEGFVAKLSFIRAVSYSELARYVSRQSTSDDHCDVLQVMNIALKNAFLKSGFSLTGKDSFHNVEADRVSLNEYSELSIGINASIVVAEKDLQLIVDQHSAVFLKESAISVLYENLSRTYSKPKVEMLLNDIVKGQKIRVTHLAGFYFVADGVTLKSAENIFFEVDGSSISVEEYFKKVYGQLERPDWPCLERTLINGSKSFFPIEVCSFSGQQLLKNPFSEVLAQQIRETGKIKPQKTFQKLHFSLKKVIERSEQDLKHFGLKVRVEKAISISNFKVISPPKIPNVASFHNALWKILRFVKPITLHRWVIVSMDRPEQNSKFLDFLKTVCSQKGVVFTQAPRMEILSRDCTVDEIEEIFKKYPTAEFIMFLHSENDDHYRVIKYLGDVKYGVRTQCIRRLIINKASYSSALNVLLKINAKCGGINHAPVIDWTIFPPFESLMIVGADVFHGGDGKILNPDQSGRHSGVAPNAGTSVVGMVATSAKYPHVYDHEVQFQDARKEEIVDAHNMINSLLKKFQLRNGRYPTHILFYRDGVADSQFNAIQNIEITALRSAFASLGINPKLTFLIIQKRHHTKLFRQTSELQNVLPGTVVDNTITSFKRSPNIISFFLCTHYGSLGTSNSGHYVTLINDWHLTIDQLAYISNVLAYFGARSSNAISSPVPVYYAHHCAYQSAVHKHGAWIYQRFTGGVTVESVAPKNLMFYL